MYAQNYLYGSFGGMYLLDRVNFKSIRTNDWSLEFFFVFAETGWYCATYLRQSLLPTCVHMCMCADMCARVSVGQSECQQ